MSTLFIHRDDAAGSLEEPIRDAARIATVLGSIGVRFERWPAGQVLGEGATQEAILAAYASEVARLRRECGYQSADVVRIARGTPDTAPMRAKFLSEHRHAEDEVRFFVEGAGSFYLHIDGRVFHVLCEQDDLLGVPAGTRHWFDMGTAPYFCAIRLFTNPAGWVAEFTGDPIATRFPTHDDALARLAKRS
jgi:1,2-dihydroxy-3-keto-5-methylthiopentene dioxygenase